MRFHRMIPESDFTTGFRSALVARLNACWRSSLVQESSRTAYFLCDRLLREHSPANISRLDRSLALRNLHGALAIALAFLTIVLLLSVKAAWAVGLESLA